MTSLLGEASTVFAGQPVAVVIGEIGYDAVWVSDLRRLPCAVGGVDGPGVAELVGDACQCARGIGIGILDRRARARERLGQLLASGVVCVGPDLRVAVGRPARRVCQRMGSQRAVEAL